MGAWTGQVHSVRMNCLSGTAAGDRVEPGQMAQTRQQVIPYHVTPCRRQSSCGELARGQLLLGGCWASVGKILHCIVLLAGCQSAGCCIVSCASDNKWQVIAYTHTLLLLHFCFFFCLSKPFLSQLMGSVLFAVLSLTPFGVRN